jgi:hypothetical protein
VLTERYEGIRYNSPNDVVVDGRGVIYFTDPCYGDRSLMEMEIEGVYRIDPDGAVTRILKQPDIERPNGIAISPDDRTLYLVDSNLNVGGNRKIWAFDLSTNGAFRISGWSTICPGRGGDGMRLDLEVSWIALGINRPSPQRKQPTMRQGRFASRQTVGVYPRAGRSDHQPGFRRPGKENFHVTAGKAFSRFKPKLLGWSVYQQVFGGTACCRYSSAAGSLTPPHNLNRTLQPHRLRN